MRKKDPAEGPHALEDITCIPTDEGWLYPATRPDSATRENVGYSMVDHHRASLMVDALTTAAGGSGLQPGFLRWITGAALPDRFRLPGVAACSRPGKAVLASPGRLTAASVIRHRAASAECTQRR